MLTDKKRPPKLSLSLSLVRFCVYTRSRTHTRAIQEARVGSVLFTATHLRSRAPLRVYTARAAAFMHQRTFPERRPSFGLLRGGSFSLETPGRELATSFAAGYEEKWSKAREGERGINADAPARRGE